MTSNSDDVMRCVQWRHQLCCEACGQVSNQSSVSSFTTLSRNSDRRESTWNGEWREYCSSRLTLIIWRTLSLTLTDERACETERDGTIAHRCIDCNQHAHAACKKRLVVPCVPKWVYPESETGLWRGRGARDWAAVIAVEPRVLTGLGSVGSCFSHCWRIMFFNLVTFNTTGASTILAHLFLGKKK